MMGRDIASLTVFRLFFAKNSRPRARLWVARWGGCSHVTACIRTQAARGLACGPNREGGGGGSIAG